MRQLVKYRYNVMNVDSPAAFAGIRGGYHAGCRDVYFVRMLGSRSGLAEEICDLDQKMTVQMQQGRLFYNRITQLPCLSDPDEIEYYSCCYSRWDTGGSQGGIQTKVSSIDELLARQLADACVKAFAVYKKNRSCDAGTIRKNFFVKVLYWFDFVCSGLKQWNERSCIKIAADNVAGRQQYFFYYILTLVGCDVLLIQSRADVEHAESDGPDLISKAVQIGNFAAGQIPQYQAAGGQSDVSSCLGSGRTNVNIESDSGRTSVNIESDSRQPDVSSCPGNGRTSVNTQSGSGQTHINALTESQAYGSRNYSSGKMNADGNLTAKTSEKSFEELAQLASSIVMIAVHNKNGDVAATGSGIMVGKNGYILTNEHVARGGYFYSIRIENDEKVYQTDELIKYHSDLDLALMRISRRLEPLPIYQGEKKLVRGQSVVAIGSPLGLFNSVSNGIISGFRILDGVQMIQFTAPISNGSSGGAVLNLNGEVIGISTAGFDRGQNINLAVGYESINMFVQGFQS